MNLAILGTGSFGRAIGNLCSANDIPVLYGSRHPEEASLKLGEAKILSFREAVAAGSLVLLAVPASTAVDVLSSCRPLDGMTLIDATNPVNADWSLMPLANHLSIAETIQDAFPSAFVVKAFNNIFADAIQTVPNLSKLQRPTVFVAGSHPESKTRVMNLIEQIDLPAMDSGRLENARYLEAMAHLNIQLALVMKYGTAGSFKYS